MTCIVGIEKGGKAWLGGDSAGTSPSGEQGLIADPKVFVKGNIAFGVCGSPKVMDWLRHATDLPAQASGATEREYLVKEVVPTIKASLKAGECLHEDGEHFHGEILIGYKGRIYRMQSNFQILTSANGFESVGSGSPLARGSLHATKGMRNVKKRITLALEAACAGNAACRPPFTIIKV